MPPCPAEQGRRATASWLTRSTRCAALRLCLLIHDMRCGKRSSSTDDVPVVHTHRLWKALHTLMACNTDAILATSMDTFLDKPVIIASPFSILCALMPPIKQSGVLTPPAIATGLLAGRGDDMS